MLVLSRKVGQSLIIGNNIRVKVVEIRGQQVRLGLEAPSDVTVVREELHKAVADANVQAAKPSDASIASLASALRKTRPKKDDDK